MALHPAAWFGRALARYLSRPSRRGARPPSCAPAALAATLRRGDVLLVEGSSRFSTAIKYLTQSTWSHAALCVQDPPPPDAPPDADDKVLLEADLIEGVRLVSWSRYADSHTRICRPVGLRADELDVVVTTALARLGQKYDLKNVIDLARYLIQRPPVPERWKRRLLALGSGDPTRAICSSLIAQSFAMVRYPILPDPALGAPLTVARNEEFVHIRQHNLFTPRDFDISPYFEVVKPALAGGFDQHRVRGGSAG